MLSVYANFKESEQKSKERLKTREVAYTCRYTSGQSHVL